MPNYTFLEIVNAVKEEGRVNRSNELDNMIKRIINEVMVKHTRNKEYPDLFVPNTLIPIPADGTSNFALPADFTKISQVRYTFQSGGTKYLNKANQFSLPFLTGYPALWYIAGSRLYVHPYSDTLTVDSIYLDYYKVPSLLVADGDVLAIDDLYPVIVNETLSRVRRYHDDTAGDDRFARDAKEAITTTNE